MNLTQLKTSQNSCTHEEHLDNIRRARSVREIGYHHNRIIKTLISILDNITKAHKTPLSSFEKSMVSLTFMDEELRLLLVVLVSFPVSDRKDKLSGEIDKTRIKCLTTQSKLTAVISKLAHNMLVTNDQYSSTYSFFTVLEQQVQSLFPSTTIKANYGYSDGLLYCYVSCDPISAYSYKPDDFFILCSQNTDPDTYTLGVSFFKYPAGSQSCSLSYSVSQSSSPFQIKQAVLSLCLLSGYMPLDLHTQYFSAIDSNIATSTIGWLNTNLTLKLVLNDKTTKQSTLTIINKWLQLLSSLIFINDTHKNLYKNPFVNVKQNNNTIFIDLNLIPILNINHGTEQNINLDMLKDRLIFLANTLKVADSSNFTRKANKILSVVQK